VLKGDSERNSKNSGKYKVAIIDDDLSTLEFIATVLSDNSNYEILTYENASYFIPELDKNRPDLLFLDLMMPEMDGFQLMTYLRDSGIYIPIVVITAMTQKEAVMKAQKFGVKSFMTKPLHIERIIKKADEILRTNF